MERVAGGQIWWVVNKLNSNFAEASIEKKLYTQSYFPIGQFFNNFDSK